MKHLLAAVCAAALTLWPRSGVAEDETLTLEGALARARERAPAIVAAGGAIEEARGRLVGASVLLRDNPEIEASAGARMTDRGELLEGSLGVRQLFELGGRRAARIAGANAAVARASPTTADVTRRVLRDTAMVFWAAVHAGERQHLAEQAAALAEETRRIAERRHHTGDIGSLELNIATTAAARARSEVRAQMAIADGAIGALRVTLGMGADEPLVIRGDLRDHRRYVECELLAQAKQRPDLQALTAAVGEAQADVRLGRALQWPNLGLGAAYERDDGNNIAMGLVTVTLPVFERGQGVRAEAVARERRTEFEIEASRRAIDTEVRAALAVYQRRSEAVRELERDALPVLDENERLARRGFELGELRLADLLVIRREVLDTKSEYLGRLLEEALASVELEASAGVLR